jgi:hypothetical protein
VDTALRNFQMIVGDPADMLVITPYPLIHDSVITVRPIGVLRMTDEGISIITLTSSGILPADTGFKLFCIF